MEIKEVSDEKVWEGFFENRQEKTFLQSWNWGETQKKLGNKIWRLGLYDKGALTLALLATKIAARRGTFLLAQHCLGMPELLFGELKKIAKSEKCSFLRLAPLLERNEKNVKLFKELGFIAAPMHASAYEATIKLDLAFSEDEILASMRKTTRYLIRQGEKNKEIKIDKSDKIEDVGLYNKLIGETTAKKRFVPFAPELVKSEFETFSKDNQALLFLGKYKEELAAAALIIFWSGIAFYHQAALSPKHRKIPVAYLLQWEVIKEAKKRGCKFYDFWGYVDPQKYPHHPWAGPSFFKAGFGGKVFEYVKTQDLPLSKKYWLTYAFEKLRKIKRGL